MMVTVIVVDEQGAGVGQRVGGSRSSRVVVTYGGW